MKKLAQKLTGLAWALTLAAGTFMIAGSATTVVSQRALAQPPACDGLPCGPCGSRCVCNTPSQICVEDD
jgi:hypothetical protein